MEIKLEKEKMYYVFVASPMIILFALLIFIILPDEKISVGAEELELSLFLYHCEDPFLSLDCHSLSKVNKFGAQTRCYIYSEELSYKICKKGWVKK